MRSGAGSQVYPWVAHFQRADLHTLWKIKRAGKRWRDWGELHISDTGYVDSSQGNVWFSLCQFRDNVLIACNLPPAADTPLAQVICDTLSEMGDLQVLCACLDAGKSECTGQCFTQTTHALGICMSVGGGVGISSTHPSALTAD